jgi:hypothetical protein
MKSQLWPVIASDQFCHIRCLHAHAMMMKNAVIVPAQAEVGYIKRMLKRCGWLDYPRWVRSTLVSCHVNYDMYFICL